MGHRLAGHTQQTDQDLTRSSETRGPTPGGATGEHDNSLAQERLSRQLDASEPDHGYLQAAITQLEGDDEPGDGDGDGDGAQPLSEAWTQLEGAGPEPAGEGSEAGIVAPALPPGFADTLGLTKPNNGFVAPEIKITVEERASEDWWDWSTYWVANLAPTTSTDAVHWSVATPPGLHDMGTDTFDLSDGPETFTMLLEVSSADYAQIAAAEQEHLDDYLQAYTITLKAAADVINVLSASDFFADTEQEARQSVMDTINARLHPKLASEFPESAPLVWKLACSNLILLATSRDANGWHTAKTVLKEGGIDLENKTITQVIDFSKTQIGAHPSSEHVSLDKLP